MPPKKTGNRLTAAEVEILRRWIEQGGRVRPALGLDPARALPLPKSATRPGRATASTSGSSHRLEQEGLKPSPEADRYTLLRRASLDLRGLAADARGSRSLHPAITAPDAYERAVDRFLDDPAYGERWARMWLDLARYADSAGLRLRPARGPTSGDIATGSSTPSTATSRMTGSRSCRSPATCCPIPSLEDRIATAFHRNTMTNTEGGTDDEEFRVAAIKDRVDTTMQVWMGLTIGCAKCHSHKFDPITQEEYYRFYAIFNQTADNDQPDESPIIPAPTPEIAEASANSMPRQLAGELESRHRSGQWESSCRPTGAAKVPRNPGDLDTPAGSGPSPRPRRWRHYRHRTESSRSRQIAALEKSGPGPDVPVMVELPANRRRTTRCCARGTSSTPATRSSRACPRRCIPYPAGDAGEPAGPGPMAGRPEEPADGAGRGQPVLGPALRRGAGRDRGGLRHPGRAAQPSRAAGLAGGPLPRIGLGHQGPLAADRHLGDVPAVVEGHGRSCWRRTRATACWRGAAGPARGRDGPRPGPGA